MIKAIHMRSIIIFLVFIMAAGPLHSQVPSQKEMQAQMKEVVNELNKQIADLEKQIADAKKNKEDPETIKELEDQRTMLKKQVEMMGGVTKGLANTSEKTYNQAIKKVEEGEDTIYSVPKLDKKRIGMMPKETLTDAELAIFVKKVHSEVERLMPKNLKNEAQRIYTTAKAENTSSNGFNNIATSLWLSGNNELAIYVLGKQCVDDMKYANNLCNYAAFLTIAGAEHAALPILQNLSTKATNNSTVLNNIGQAWYRLGDMSKAEKFLDEAIKVYRNHGQANQTKCAIQRSKGQKGEAIESMKRAIQENYTTEKENVVEDLGGKLKFEDVPFRYPFKPMPLGIEKFLQAIPDYPFEGGATADKSYLQWKLFKEKVGAAKEVSDKRIEILKERFHAYQKRLIDSPELLKPFNNPVNITAKRSLMLFSEWSIDRQQALNKEYIKAADSINIWKDEFDKAMAQLIQCGSRKDAATAFLSKANTLQRQLNEKSLRFNKKVMNVQANLFMYTSTDISEYELLMESIKNGVLTALGGLQCWFEVGCLPAEVPPEGLRKPLPDFDSVNCKYKDTIRIPPFTTIKTQCNKMETLFEVDTELSVKIKVGWAEDLNSGKLEKGTVELGYEWGPQDPVLFGPKESRIIGAELKGELGIGMEITNDGVKEIYIKGSTSIDLAGAMDGEIQTPAGASGPKGLSGVGAEVKLSWNVGKEGGWGTNQNSASGKIANFWEIDIGGN